MGVRTDGQLTYLLFIRTLSTEVRRRGQTFATKFRGERGKNHRRTIHGRRVHVALKLNHLLLRL